MTRLEQARAEVARQVERDSDNPLRVAEANAIYAGERDDSTAVKAELNRLNAAADVELVRWHKQLVELPVDSPVPEDLQRAIRMRFNTARNDLMSGDSGYIIHRRGHALDLLSAIRALENRS